MTLKIRRIILFSKDMRKMSEFYREVIGLSVKEDASEDGWLEFDAGGCSLALHKSAKPPIAGRGPKVVFYCDEVAKTRETLVKKGAKLGKPKIFGSLHLCDGRDPEGNIFQLSNRP